MSIDPRAWPWSLTPSWSALLADALRGGAPPAALAALCHGFLEAPSPARDAALALFAARRELWPWAQFEALLARCCASPSEAAAATCAGLEADLLEALCEEERPWGEELRRLTLLASLWLGPARRRLPDPADRSGPRCPCGAALEVP